MRFDHAFRRRTGRTTLGLAALSCAGIAALTASHPAAAAAALAAVQSAVSCATTTGCVAGNNTSTGPGVTGTSAKGAGITANGVTGLKATGKSGIGVVGSSNSGYGVSGTSTTGKAGVAGSTASSYGVYGFTSGSSGGIGVYGMAASGGYGLYGTTSTGSGIGVVGSLGGAGTGVYGASSSGYGMEGQSSSGYALYGNAYGTGTAGYLSAASGGYGLISYSVGSVAVYGRNSSGNGADLTGTYIGVVGRAPASGGFPIVATDSNSNDLFYVDGAGNVSYHGGLFKFAFVPGGGMVKSFTPNTTLPTVEDTGTTQLVNGTAAVRLDPAFAASIDSGSSYRVFVTPNGDTRGLFVAMKTANGFVVRESQGGRSTVSFDYRIVATAAGQAGQRMAVTPAFGPHALAPNAPHLASAPFLAPASRPSTEVPQ